MGKWTQSKHSRNPQTKCLCWRSRWSTGESHEEISMVCLNVTRSWSGQGRKGNLWQGKVILITLVHLATWAECAQWGCSNSRKKKYGVSKYTTHFNTPKDQEAELFYEWHSVSMIPKMTLRFNCSLGFIEIKKSVILMLYYNEMMLIKISKRKRCMEQSPGETKHMLSSPSAVIRIALSNS